MKPSLLIQLDTDAHASSFDAVVAIDSGVDHLLQYCNVEPADVEALVHGAMFTRGGDDLARTAIFIGGSDAGAAENLLKKVCGTFFGPVRVSVMLDASGCNTTAAAAVLTAGKHVDLNGSKSLVLAGTGPVGRRAAAMLATAGSSVTLTSRSADKAAQIAGEIGTPVRGVGGPNVDVERLIDDADVVIGCGAAGVQLADQDALATSQRLKVAIDLNAVPPAGLGGIEAADRARPLSDRGAVQYGAIGVGGLKMEIHRAAIEQLFKTNDAVLDADAIYQLAVGLTKPR